MASKVGDYGSIAYPSKPSAVEQESTPKQSSTQSNQIQTAEVTVLRKNEDDAVRVTLSDRREGGDSKLVDMRDIARAKARKVETDQSSRAIESSSSSQRGSSEDKQLTDSGADEGLV